MATTTVKGTTMKVIQVPCRPTGDCAVHALVDKNGALQNLVVVDGGKAESKNFLRFVLRSIAQKYTSKAQTTREAVNLVDAWVVTHWDQDHYVAALNLFTSCGTKKGFRIYYPEEPDEDKHKTVYKVLKEQVTDDKVWSATVGKKCIGVDFFTGVNRLQIQPTDTDDTRSTKIKTNLIKQIKEAPQDQFLCLGSNGYITTTEGLKQRQGPASETNWKSIIALMVSENPNGNTPNTKPFRAAYYCAGDGNLNSEVDLEALFKASNITVNTMKGTHHGSIKAFNQAFFEQCKPTHYMVSAGSEYGHPSAALLVKLWHDKYTRNTKSPPVEPLEKLFTGYFPYWFRALNRDTTDLNNESVLRQIDNMPATAQDELKKLDPKWWPEVENMMAELKQKPPKIPKTEEGSLLMISLQSILEKIWEQLSASLPPSAGNEDIEHAVVGSYGPYGTQKYATVSSIRLLYEQIALPT